MKNVGEMQTGEQIGTLTLGTEDILTFSGGLAGFEEFKRYVILADEACVPFLWLLSVDEAQLGFPIVPIELVYPEFGRDLLPEILKRGQNQDERGLLIYGIITLGDPLERSTVNLKGPIVVDPEQGIGRQVILTSEECPTDYPIVQV